MDVLSVIGVIPLACTVSLTFMIVFPGGLFVSRFGFGQGWIFDIIL